MCILFSISAFSKATIFGKIINTTCTGLKISYLTNIIEDDNYTDFYTTVDKKGNFKIEIEINQLKSVILNVGNKYLPLYIEPNDSLNIFSDNKDFFASLRFSGKGSGNNNLRHKKFKEFGHLFYSGIDRTLVQSKAEKSNAQEFTLFTDSLSNYYNTYLENNKKDLSLEFYKYTKTSLYFLILNQKIIYRYFNYNNIFKKGEPVSLSPYFEYYRFLDSITVSQDSLLSNEYYRDFLQLYLNLKRDFTLSSLNNKYATINQKYAFGNLPTYYLSDMLFSDKTREYMLAYSVHSGFFYSTQKKEREKLYSFAKKDIKDSSYLKIIEKSYQNNLSRIDELQINDQFPDFNLKDIKGNTITLNSLKGKVVFVDFWGAWCKGCMAEMPKVKELKEKLGNKKNQIAYLYFNCFDQEIKWKETIEKNQIEGLHFHLPKKENIDFFAINGFPKYFLLDRNGKIVKVSFGLSDDFSSTEILKVLESN